MRIIAGAWRGRALAAPPGDATRPTADRVRQAIFDRLMHAPWAMQADGRACMDAARVLDAFAGTGAMGLEALSRGAAEAVFIETDRAALAALRANVVSCGAGEQSRVIAGSALRPPAGAPCSIVFLDPPYGSALAGPAVAALTAAGWIAPGTLLVLEVGRADTAPDVGLVVAEFTAGAASVVVARV
jgi:16S rRNA (guanine966-N2)-methyltransferase